MTVTLTDFLIQLSDPRRKADFDRDPRASAEAAGLSQTEIEAILMRDPRKIRLQAQSREDSNNDLQFSRHHSDVLIAHLDPTVHVDMTHHQQVTVEPGIRLLVDNGMLYRAIRDED